MKMIGRVAAISLFVPAMIFVAGCRKHAEQTHRSNATAVRVQTIQAKPHVAVEEVVGTVRPKQHSIIEAKIAGRIEKVFVLPGEQVKQGDVLVQLDAREAKARLDQAMAQRQQAENDFKRAEQLRSKQIITEADFDTAQSKTQVAIAATVEAETYVAYATITAPFDGVITRKLAEVGDLATPGKSLLELEDPRVLQFEAAIPEAVIDSVRLMARYSVRVLSAEVQGTVSEIAPSAEANTRTFTVKLDLPVAAGLRAGQFGHVQIPVSETNVLRAPATAVLQRGQMELVFVVAKKQAQLRLVKTGRRFGDEIELLSGVEAGEQVVADKPGALVDGQAVEPRS